jgi:hypothetical protein
MSHTAQLRMKMNTHDPRFVRLHGNLHWLVEQSGSETLQLLGFDMSWEVFWSVGTPARQGGLAMARIGLALASGAGKLCIFTVLPSTSTMEMWDCGCSIATPAAPQPQEAGSLRRGSISSPWTGPICRGSSAWGPPRWRLWKALARARRSSSSSAR